MTTQPPTPVITEDVIERHYRKKFHQAAFLAAMQGDWANHEGSVYSGRVSDDELDQQAVHYKRAADAATKVMYGDGGN